MTILGAHTDIYPHVRTAVDEAKGELRGKRARLGIASFALSAWRNDVAEYYRRGEAAGSYRQCLCRQICRLSQAVGDAGTLVVLIDGARLPAKAAEHARRGNVAQDRATLLKDAAAFDKDGQLDKADDLYRELA
jgi:hypothetical protein